MGPARPPPCLESRSTAMHESVLVLCAVADVDVVDAAVEGERRPVVVIQGERGAQAGADVQAVVRAEQQRRADRHNAFRDGRAVNGDGDVEWSPGAGLD